MNEREPAPLWLALLLVFTVPLWVPLVPAAVCWQAWRDRRRPVIDVVVDTLPLLEFFDQERPAT